MASKVTILRDFFSVPGKPVTNEELMAFAKADREGWTKLAEEVAKATGQTIDKV